MSCKEFLPEELEIGILPRPRPETGEVWNPEQTAEDIAACHGLKTGDLYGNSREPHVCVARVALYRELRRHGWSYPAIGRFCGGRHHSTVLQQLRAHGGP